MTSPIKKHRTATGLSRTELAVLLGTSVPLVGVLERGETLPQPPHLKTLAGAFGVSEDRLMNECQRFRAHIRANALRKIHGTVEPLQAA